MMRALLLLLLLPPAAFAQGSPFEFTRMVAHWDVYRSPDYVKFM